MTFLSFAQNFEDIVLWRALRDVEQGFYIDVGANEPIEDSVTKAFYERGWHGINVEPVTEHFDALVQDRPRDINLACALGEKPGRLTLYEIDARGLSTNAPEIANRYRESGRVYGEREVEVRTLADVCEAHAPADIHFLKIDVEGFERNVLLGADFKRFRPWILVIEATEPNSPVDNSAEWESLVIDAGYEYAYFDGLNRFYVAAEHRDLKPRIAVAPNVFDRAKLRRGHCFVLDPEVSPDEHRALQDVVAERERALAASNDELAALRSELAAIRAQLAEANLNAAHSDAQVMDLKRQLATLQADHARQAERLAQPLVRMALRLTAHRDK
ncbi:FkbM family methyltransferase [Burkholderia sp. AU19243]|uniref:FkbM family methyltransferase n=1 Tax=Burkholderia sp. AU19243 TaxID=2824810 RepID=UPI0004F7631A|nr:FkbM family methyltransferase [Burkholderia sp. AU19243]AIO40949.1 methyltransferase, FkbM family domain protein [Burkholderia cenocepacia]MBR7963263.1 FkbM family methyltransferase [Burkholderia vietnamiensis]MBR8140828.1 FkbM family methyltransferase [Burkholderia vietnamiensis]MBR8361785.1 FkbM family methyltransferase [Burkholderia sp. AU19243]